MNNTILVQARPHAVGNPLPVLPSRGWPLRGWRSIRPLVALTFAIALTFSESPVRADEDVADLYRASYALEARNDAAGALAKMQQVQAQRGATYFVRARIGWLAYLAGQYAPSIRAYNDAIRMKPKSVEARLGLTLPLLAEKRWRDLDRACREVLKLAPSDMKARARLAHALYSVGNYPDSATRYRKLIEEYPSDLTFQTGLGWAVLKMGRRAEARTTFQQVLAVSPDNASARAGMAAAK